MVTINEFMQMKVSDAINYTKNEKEITDGKTKYFLTEMKIDIGTRCATFYFEHNRDCIMIDKH